VITRDLIISQGCGCCVGGHDINFSVIGLQMLLFMHKNWVHQVVRLDILHDFAAKFLFAD
jgi:hypothetical protein